MEICIDAKQYNKSTTQFFYSSLFGKNQCKPSYLVLLVKYLFLICSLWLSGFQQYSLQQNYVITKRGRSFLILSSSFLQPQYSINTTLPRGVSGSAQLGLWANSEVTFQEFLFHISYFYSFTLQAKIHHCLFSNSTVLYKNCFPLCYDVKNVFKMSP